MLSSMPLSLSLLNHSPIIIEFPAHLPTISESQEQSLYDLFFDFFFSAVDHLYHLFYNLNHLHLTFSKLLFLNRSPIQIKNHISQMANSGTLQNLYSSSTSLNWDLHNLGVFNPDMSSECFSVMEATAPFFAQADFSTGYLQDALVEWNDRCKRRRLDFYDRGRDCLENVVQSYWNLNWIQDPPENFICLNKITEANRVSDESLNSSNSSISEGETIFSEIKTLEESVSAPETNNSPHKDPLVGSLMHEKKTQISREPGSSSDEGGFKRKKKVITGVVYPFAIVKPGGVDGDMTLNDINERILMPPTRPVRHPVGDFAGRPFVSPDGPGLSGKAVVAFTKIHTQGRGTITIIRTRG